MGIIKPPRREDIQISPCADALFCNGIQSVIMRDSDGKAPAWNTPKRKRTNNRNRNGSIQ